MNALIYYVEEPLINKDTPNPEIEFLGPGLISGLERVLPIRTRLNSDQQQYNEMGGDWATE